MPAATRRRAASGASTPSQTTRPLENYCLCFSGKFAGYTHKSLHSLFMGKGASVTAAVSNKNTHLVCDEKDYNKNAPKVADAKACGVAIVKPEWVDQVAKLDSKVEPDNYLWHHNGDGDEAEEDEEDNQEEAKLAANSNGKKRTNGVATSSNNSDGADEVKPKSKKAKAKAVKAEQEEDVADPVDEEEETLERKIKELSNGQFLTKKGLVIPLDEHCPLQDHSVYIEPDSGMIFDASLNQSSTSRNNNKFYRLQVLVKGSDYRTWTRWGRVGEMGQNAILGDGSLEYAKKYFERKFRDKSGLAWKDRGSDPKPNKYAFVERSYDVDSDADDDDDNKGSGNGVKKEDDEDDWKPPECTLSEPVREVMELIFNQNFFNATMSSLNYDANKLPLGKLSKATILRGFQQLKDLAALMDNPFLATSQWNMSVGAATEHLSNTYFSLIPHAFGRNRPPIINSESQLKKEIELLESLSDMKDAANIMKIDRSKARNVHPMDSHYLSLGLEEMCVLDNSSKEFNLLQSYLHGSKGSTHGIDYKVRNIFRIERAGEHQRFADSPFTNIPSDKRLLWHGSRCTNFGGILSQGLRIAPPEAPVSGYMFGKGIYLADMSSKSAGYCFSHISNRHALLLLCEAELGDPMQKLTSASYSAGEDAKQNGMHSTWGMGTTGPSKWTDAGVVHKSLKGTKIPDTKVAPGATNIGGSQLLYNEFICYDIAQVKLRYLFHVEI